MSDQDFHDADRSRQGQRSEIPSAGRRPRGRPRNAPPPFQNPAELIDERALVEAIGQTQAGQAWRQLLELTAASERQRLPEVFDLLVERGCSPQILGLVLWLLRTEPTALKDFLHTLQTLVGSPELRDTEARALEQAAVALDAVRTRFSTSELDWTVAAKLGRLTPKRLSAELRSYANVLRFERFLSYVTGVQSVDQLGRYVLTAYVERATNRPHHEAVARLIGDARSRVNDEPTHRRWRRRNFERINQHFSGVINLLVALGSAAKT